MGDVSSLAPKSGHLDFLAGVTEERMPKGAIELSHRLSKRLSLFSKAYIAKKHSKGPAWGVNGGLRISW